MAMSRWRNWLVVFHGAPDQNGVLLVDTEEEAVDGEAVRKHKAKMPAHCKHYVMRAPARPNEPLDRVFTADPWREVDDSYVLEVQERMAQEAEEAERVKRERERKKEEHQ